MAVSGLPKRRADHPEAIAEFALDLLDVVQVNYRTFPYILL